VAESRLPKSSQTGPHRRLEETVHRHMRQAWRAPIHDYSRRAFAELVDSIDPGLPVVLDSGCGTGASTVELARRHPESLVVGVDKSQARLGRAPERPGNARLIRSELADFWRLALEAGWRPVRHYVLYPNPWPKPGHLKRRWHGHPAFPTLLELGGRLELRSNFALYVEEFADALALAGVLDVKVVSFLADEPISPFERKYEQSGHRLFKLTATLE
jgi:tRNA G46 methylase TrmB